MKQQRINLDTMTIDQLKVMSYNMQKEVAMLNQHLQTIEITIVGKEREAIGQVEKVIAKAPNKKEAPIKHEAPKNIKKTKKI